MKKTFKKWCGILLALSMVLVMLPVTAYATVTGSMDIGGTTVSNLNASGTGWAWNANTDTLTLTDEYDGSPITINCAGSDVINLVYSGDVSLSAGTTTTIYCKGSLNISESGSGGTLTLINTADSLFEPLFVSGALTISSGTIIVNGKGNNDQAVHAGGDFTIGEDAIVTVTSQQDRGVQSSGDIYLSGTLTATGGGTYSDIVCDELFVTGGTLTTGVGRGTNGYVATNVIVSGGTANITGDISGDLIVTSGLVTVSGTVDKSVYVIGGTVSVNGKTVEVNSLSSLTLVLDASATGANPFHLAAVTGPAANVSGYTWNGAAKKLTLSGLSYESDMATALRIVNGAVEIVLADGTNNSFVSNYSGNGNTYGIYADDNLTISGSGTLAATGGASADGYSVGIGSYDGNLTVNNGAVTATGGSSGDDRSYCISTWANIYFNGGSITAIGNNGGFYTPNGNLYLPSAYTWWANTAATDPGGAGTDGAVTSLFDNATGPYLFVKLAAPSATPTPAPTPVSNTETDDEEDNAPQTTVKDGEATATTTVSNNYGSEIANKTIVGKADVNKAINAALEAAKKNGAIPKIEIKIDIAEKAEKVQASIPVASLSKAAKNEVQSFSLVTGLATIAFDNDALKGLSSQATDSTLRISAAKVNTDTLSDEVKAKIGGASVFEFTIMDGTKAISDFGGGKATVTVPYTLKSGESADGIVVWYVGSDGTLNKVDGAKYDASTKTVTFETTHFSTYAIDYNPAAAAAPVSSEVADSAAEPIPDTGDSFAFATVIMFAIVALGAGITAKKAR